ncbi:sugar kinase [Pleomorphomonas sp. JP5]|uniref:sugar kinase n=1 Tax=Pleomorphomonas sp. JP5 TaxID=2942998 RepID=UPI0020446DCF|nr:sugar kinase [Pleomorphomonas sp. JP5]MCM5557107.1 sugar kinase [Pleomorphomonas sp. JP5]
MAARFASIGECMVELAPQAGGLYQRGFAGDTLNTAWYLRALLDRGKSLVKYVTGVGSDALSDEMVDFIASAGIDTSAIDRVAGRTVGLYLITLNGAERSFTYWRNESAAKLLASVSTRLDAALADVDVAYFSGITLAILSSEHRRALFAALAKVRARGGEVVFDPNLRPRLWPDPSTMAAAIIEGYRAATIALPTSPDDAELYGDADAIGTADRIAALGVREVVVKAGAEPTLVRAGGLDAWVAAERVDRPVDTTGAGDSFNAGYLAARLAGGRSPAEAVRHGHAVAARVIQARGALIDMNLVADLGVGAG